MEQLDRIIDEDNKLTLYFHETKSMIILDKIIEYFLSFNYKYSYIIFGHNSNQFDMSFYAENYPELVNSDCGAILLREEDRNNILLIYDVLNNFNIGNLYINNEPNMLNNFCFEKWQAEQSEDLHQGYMISDMLYEYMTIRKDQNIQNWCFENMGISSISIEEKTNTEQRSKKKQKKLLIGKIAILICVIIAVFLLFETISNLFKY